jgi:ATP-dependent protease ClpP protease subunit
MKTLSRIIASGEEKAGELYVYGPIGGSLWIDGITSQAVVGALKVMTDGGAKALTIFINSPGGDAFEGIAILNCLKRFPGAKTVMVDGLAASAASIIAMAGDRICMGSGAMMMVHNAAARAQGNAQELRETADMLEKVSDSLVSAYADRTGLDPAAIKELLDAETWMSPAEAIERGFATEQFEQGDSTDATAFADSPLLAQYRHTPKTILAAARRTDDGAAVDQEHEPMKTLLSKLGLAENASEPTAVAAVEALNDSQTKILALTGEKTVAAAFGVVQAWKASADQLVIERKNGADAEAKRAEAELVTVVDAAVKDGKAAPAQRDALIAMGHANPETLKTFLAHAPKIHAEQRGTPEKKPSDAVTLTDEEKKMARVMNQTEDQVLEAKRKAIADGRSPFQTA